MRLWGKVMSGSLMVFAAVFMGVGLFVPEARGVCLGAAAVCATAALLGVPVPSSKNGNINSLSDGSPNEQTESASVHLWERVERSSPLVVRYVSGQPECPEAP